MSPYTVSTWSLTDLFPGFDSPEMKQGLETLQSTADGFAERRVELIEDIQPERFLEILRQFEEISRLASRINAFASLNFSADTQDQTAQTFLAQIQQVLAGVENRTLFFSLWWKALGDASAQHLMEASGDYHAWLEQMRLFKPYTLSEPEESIINVKNTTGFSALTTLYNSLTNRYAFNLKIEGEAKELTRGELMVHVRRNDPNLRAAAYQELYRVFGQDGPILGQIYQTLVRDWHNEQQEMRGFASPLSARNLTNDIPDSVVDTLLDVSQKNTQIFQRFFRLKARLMGMDKLRRYDIYAPVVASEKTYLFEQAAELVLESFARFDPRLDKLARRVFDERRLDSSVRKGKRNGAFCYTVSPELTPWVLVNYQMRAEDVATLAHELGHAVHSMLAEHHNLFTQQSSLPLAETASTFGEMMLIDRLLEQESDESVHRDLLFRQVEDSYATIMRQTYFALFEREAHGMVQHGASVDDLAEAYLKNLLDQFGDSIWVAPEFRWEWVSIPHIYHVPFYVYAYAFGQLLVLSLYEQYKTEGDPFKPRYLDILSAGGSDSPVQILLAAGIDVYDPAFWQGGFDVIAQLVDQLEQLH